VVAPVYPVVAGALEVFAGGVWAVYLFQTLCHAGTAVATYLLAVGFTGRRVAALAGLLVAGDAMLAVMNFEAMTEPLFMLLATVGVMLWIRELALLGARPPRFGMAVLTGLVLGLATLTRSTSAYLPILMFAAQVGLGVIQRRWRLLGHAATLLVVFYMVTNAWTLFRSSCLTDSPAGSAHIVYVYSAGAGAYQVEFGISREEAQDRIRREFNLLSFEEVSNPWIIDPEDAKTRRHPREVVREVLSRFPRSLLISSLLGIAKASISHNVHTLAYMSGHQWTSVGLDRIRRGQFSEAWRQLAQNPPLLVVLFLWEIGFVAVVCVFGLVGTIWGLLLARWRVVAICLLLVVAYYNATIAAVGIDAFYKYRTMIVPFWCLAASIGACEMGSVIMRRVRGKRETDV
jgi:4-amino-4-deoxy-L-arabinose transferase-like glycosyltransferase